MKGNVDSTQKPPTILSFCPGILGLERGIERVIGKLSVLAYVEIEAVIIANLVAGMEAGILDPTPIWTDARTFDARPFLGKVHGIIGGYPCPGESKAGAREGHRYPGWLWPAVRKAFSAAKPLWGFFENVEGHLTGTYPIVQRSLRNMGYASEAGLYSAGETSQSHSRKRVFILAVAYPYLQRIRTVFPGLRKESSPFEGKTWEQNWQWLRNEFSCCSTEMGYTNGIRCESRDRTEQPRITAGQPSDKMGNPKSQRKWVCDQQSKATNQTRKPSDLLGYRYQRPSWTEFPLGQGTCQWDWEEPRQVKSKMEFTIDGYDFRPDLVRAVGNSVAEHAAELAWTDLWRQILMKL